VSYRTIILTASLTVVAGGAFAQTSVPLRGRRLIPCGSIASTVGFKLLFVLVRRTHGRAHELKRRKLATYIDVQQCVRFCECLERLLGATRRKIALQGRPAAPLRARRLILCGSIASSVSSRRQKWW
jgi:hypothetical protein